MIQTFDPQKHFGANQARLQNYINLCLTNKFRSLYSKRRKDALSQPGNMSLDAQTEWNDPRAVDDEFCHSHSVHLQRAANASVLRKLEPTFQIQNARPQLRERVIAEQRVREPAARTVENLRLDQSTMISWNRVELYNELESTAGQVVAQIRNLRCQAGQGVSETENTSPRTRVLGEGVGRSNFRTSPSAGVQGCACCKETDQRIEAEETERRQNRPSKRTLRKSLRKQFLKNRLGIRV